MSKLTPYFASLAITLTLPTLILAQSPLAYEPFSYVAGQELNHMNGGTGFGNPISPNEWSTIISTSATITSAGLTYGPLLTTGNAVAVKAADPNNLVVDFTAPRNLTDKPGTNADGSFWLSFLMQRNNNTSTSSGLPFQSNEYAGITIGGASEYPNENQRTFIGAATVNGGSSNDIRYTVGTNGDPGSDVASNTVEVANAEANNVVLIVAKVTVSTGLVDVFINPTTLGTGTGPSTSDFSHTNSTFSNGLTIAMVYGNNADYTIDELRIGLTYLDVTPVPEPTSILALSVMAVGGVWLKKRKQKIRQEAFSLAPQGSTI
ncbi:MAG: PEP-CTERM sorting domain-containing protein [Gemmataceae bacterium]